MKIKLEYRIFLFFITLLLLQACHKEESAVIDPEKEVFNFVVSDSQRQYINTSRREQYQITDPLPELQFAGNVYTIDRFEIRGDNTLNFTRKGFGVNMDKKISLINPEEQTERKYEEFKLLAMVYDYTYIENSTAVGSFKEVGLWPVYDFFTEVRLNNHTQGLYHFIEDPFEYFIEQKNASFVVRRGYDHVIKASSVSPDNQQNLERYIARFRRIYSNLPLYSGRQMYDTLSSYMDLEQYFTKLSIDMLVKNGDYTDESIFYTKTKNGKEVLGVFPWDYDDIFSGQPHEIGNPWAPGTVFGKREYYSMNDVIADVGSKLLYSIEDDLDYKIARDNFLYQEYLKTLRSVVEKIDLAAIDKIFDYTNEHIGAFYDNDSIIEQSKYDALYLSESDAEIGNTIFMFAKDDGLDSGNVEGGEINLTNCRFEACFHEGAALSSGNSAVKNHTFTECVFTNCGQGLELGFSSPNHTVVADKCLFLYNGIGIRYGDNYDWSEVDGKMLIKNSFSLYNDKDVWNMVRINWSHKLQNMVFENTRVSALCPQYPGLELYR